MQLTAEISMYPLRDDYLPPIEAVIKRLKDFADIQVHCSATATTLVGDFYTVMAAIQETLLWSHERYGKAVFVAKFIPGYSPD